jgi:predicted transposase YbfD/YdcC
MERCRLQRVELTPEEAGLCGCWQFIALWRERQKLRGGQVIETSEEYVYYASSLTKAEHSAVELAGFIRDHWGAVENGSHYRRDVTLGEDASQISGRSGAQVMASLRNLVLGLYELQKQRGKTQADYLPEWQRKLSPTRAFQLITKAS